MKYLGVSLDQSLGGKYIAESILKKGNSILNVFYGDRLSFHHQFYVNIIMPVPHGLRVSRSIYKKNYNFYKIQL